MTREQTQIRFPLLGAPPEWPLIPTTNSPDPIRHSLAKFFEIFRAGRQPTRQLVVWLIGEFARHARALPQLVAAAGQVGGLGGVAGELDGPGRRPRFT